MYLFSNSTLERQLKLHNIIVQLPIYKNNQVYFWEQN